MPREAAPGLALAYHGSADEIDTQSGWARRGLDGAPRGRTGVAGAPTGRGRGKGAWARQEGRQGAARAADKGGGGRKKPALGGLCGAAGGRGLGPILFSY